MTLMIVKTIAINRTNKLLNMFLEPSLKKYLSNKIDNKTMEIKPTKYNIRIN